MEILPAEMQEKITNRLNLKDLARLRTVDKYHYNLIDYPDYKDRMMFLTKSVLKKINELHYLDINTKTYVFHKILNSLDKSRLPKGNITSLTPLTPKSQDENVSQTFKVFEIILKLDYLDSKEKELIMNAIIQDAKPYLYNDQDYEELLDYIDRIYSQEYYEKEENIENYEDYEEYEDDFIAQFNKEKEQKYDIFLEENAYRAWH